MLSCRRDAENRDERRHRSERFRLKRAGRDNGGDDEERHQTDEGARRGTPNPDRWVQRTVDYAASCQSRPTQGFLHANSMRARPRTRSADVSRSYFLKTAIS